MDFIITWVDGGDPKWQAQKAKYAKESNGDQREVRYYDWDTLRYWFRAVEAYTPWVDKIHFVTCGQCPDWLNVNHPKLNLVNHEDFIPHEYLPTFNTNPIVLNMHRISGLSEEFVYFNDDMFVTNPMKPTDFFRGGLPCDMAVMNALAPNGVVTHILCNNIECINKRYSKFSVLRKNFGKWLSPKYGIRLLRTLALMRYTLFTGFYDQHMPMPYLKDSFERVWEYYPDILKSTCETKFRSISNVSEWLVRYVRLVEGQFVPYNAAKNVRLICNFDEHNVSVAVDAIKSKRLRMICLNEGSVKDKDFVRRKLHEAFESKLPVKSTFEI